MAHRFLPLMASMRDRTTNEPVLSYGAFCRACRRQKVQEMAAQFLYALRLPHMEDAYDTVVMSESNSRLTTRGEAAMQRARTLVFGAYAFELYQTRTFENVHSRQAGMHARNVAGTLLNALRKLWMRDDDYGAELWRMACELHLAEFQDAWMAWRRADDLAQDEKPPPTGRGRGAVRAETRDRCIGVRETAEGAAVAQDGADARAADAHPRHAATAAAAVELNNNDRGGGKTHDARGDERADRTARTAAGAGERLMPFFGRIASSWWR